MNIFICFQHHLRKNIPYRIIIYDKNIIFVQVDSHYLLLLGYHGNHIEKICNFFFIIGNYSCNRSYNIKGLYGYE